MCTRLLAGLAAIVILAATVAASSGKVGPSNLRTRSAHLIASAPAHCRGSSDVYRYTAAALRRCGYRVFPLTSVKTLRGGGHAYRYSDGSTQLIPPAGFKPLNATNRQLDEYGLPVRPTNPAAAIWITEMSGWRGSVGPDQLALGGKPISARLCDTLREAAESADAPYFYECLLRFSQQPIPLGTAMKSGERPRAQL